MPDLFRGAPLSPTTQPGRGSARSHHTRIRYGLVLAGVAALFAATPPTYASGVLSAVDDSQGTPGFCPDDGGTTVVVDFRDLGGDVIIRCAPAGADRSGLEALQDAGFEVEAVQQYDDMMCRIEGRPAPDESLEIDGRKGYREACVEMPPASAYWSYWNAEDGGEWAYSRKGMQDSEAIEGGFEGWSFSLNGTTGTQSTPRIDPVRPDSGASQSSGVQDGVRWSGGEQADEPADESAAADDSGSPAPVIAAAGAIGLLAVLITVTVLRRRSRRS